MLTSSSSSTSPQSFTPERRLHYPWEYRRFFTNSQVIRLSECTIFRIPNSLGHYRLGITLKARGNSVYRNKTKRQIREAFRTSEDALGSFDYNVVVPGSRKLVHPYPGKLGNCLRKELRRAVASR